MVAGEDGSAQYIDLDLKEMGAEGRAKVLKIEPCPEIESSDDPDRHVITATFRHSASNVLDLQVEGEEKPLGVTDNHPFWSADRKKFIPAGELAVGERLQRADGRIARVVSSAPREGEIVTVHNLEVDAQHVYYVGKTGVLAHNIYPLKSDGRLSGPVPRSVPKHWRADQVEEGIMDIETSLRTRLKELEDFEAIGGGNQWQKINHLKRIESERELLRKLNQRLDELWK